MIRQTFRVYEPGWQGSKEPGTVGVISEGCHAKSELPGKLLFDEFPPNVQLIST
jgi:hypothetical protein